MQDWIIVALDAQERGDWDLAITTVEPQAMCYGVEHERHNAHLWHMDLLVKAGRLDELAARGKGDVHARRRLNRYLYETGQHEQLALRAQAGDEGARLRLAHLTQVQVDNE